MVYNPRAADVAALAKGFQAVVCIQGLGFVGSAMAVAVAEAANDEGQSRYLVVGVERDLPIGRLRAESMMRGDLPFASEDDRLTSGLRAALNRGNLITTCDDGVYQYADVAIVDVNLDLDFDNSPVTADLMHFTRAVQTLADGMPEGSLLLVETTVPPGTTTELVLPIVREALRRRGLGDHAIAVAHSYERVMPGLRHLESIVDYWRVYAGVDDRSSEMCRAFLETVINTDQFPLTRLATPTASETAKVLENSFRAVTIALMDEWGRFGERLGIDMFEVIDAIRMRPTHANMREPGLGVGGYCLTKDPLFPQVSMNTFFRDQNVDFPMTDLALAVNRQMPRTTMRVLEDVLEGELQGRKILILGASYRPDVGDTRHSPSETLVHLLVQLGAHVTVHDPLATHWELPEADIVAELPDARHFDAVVFAVAHSAYVGLDLRIWLGDGRIWVVDANHVLTGKQRAQINELPDVRLFSIGRGYE